MFIEQDAKILCCDRYETWYYTKCAKISEASYQFLSCKEAEDISWYCKSCKQPAMVAILENKSIEDKVKEHTEKINQKIKAIESNLHKKAESAELEKLQRRVEELENRIKKVQDNSQGGRSWADITDSAEKRTVQEVIKKSLKDRDNEEKERQKRQRNIIIFELPESKETNTEDRKEEDIRKFIALCRNICKVNIIEESLEKAIRLGKVSDDKERPLLITLKEENKKREIFQNLNKICEAGDPFDKITVTHDLTVK